MADRYGFNELDAKRIQRAVNDYERGEKLPPTPRGTRWSGVGYSGLQPAKNGGTLVAAGSIASPTSFTCTLMVPSGTGFTTTGGTSITAYNPYTGTIAANAFLWVTSWNNNIYVANANC